MNRVFARISLNAIGNHGAADAVHCHSAQCSYCCIVAVHCYVHCALRRGQDYLILSIDPSQHMHLYKTLNSIRARPAYMQQGFAAAGPLGLTGAP
jgi:hypothetical protein